MSAKNLIFSLLLGTALAAGIFFAAHLRQPAEVTSATVLPAGNSLPALSLLNQAAEPVNEDTFKGQWDLVFFGFTHCPDICPLTLQTLSTARRELRDAGHTSLPRIVLVSVDPERDTPALLGQYIQAFGDDNLAVTGTLDNIKVLTGALGIYFAKVPVDDDVYTVDHYAGVLLIDPQGDLRALFGAPHTVANYVHDLPILMGHE